jgi:hypothetical protein
MKKYVKTEFKGSKGIARLNADQSYGEVAVAFDTYTHDRIVNALNFCEGFESSYLAHKTLAEIETEHDALLTALEAADRLITEALPKFNWAASALDANAIKLLNEVPALVRDALRKDKE